MIVKAIEYQVNINNLGGTKNIKRAIFGPFTEKKANYGPFSHLPRNQSVKVILQNFPTFSRWIIFFTSKF